MESSRLRRRRMTWARIGTCCRRSSMRRRSSSRRCEKSMRWESEVAHSSGRTPMKKTDAFNDRYFPASGGIAWPRSRADRESFARNVLGLGFVAAHDEWIGRADTILETKGKSLGPAFARETTVRKQ